MKRKINIYTLWILSLFIGFFVSSCSSDDDEAIGSINSGKVLFNSFGPCPASRGGYLCLFGENLDKIKSVDIPGCSSITDIDVKSSGINSEIRVLIPLEESEPGTISLNLGDGSKIDSKSEIFYSEPISIENLSSLKVSPGDVLTISGEYLYLVTKVIFSNNAIVDKSSFISQSRHEIKVEVPINACSGAFSVASDAVDDKGNPMLNEIPYKDELEVNDPEAKFDLKEARVGDDLVITGSLLNMIEYVKFEGADPLKVVKKDDTVTDITKITAKIPNGSIDGDVKIILYSGKEISLGHIHIIVPEISIENPEKYYTIDDIVTIKNQLLTDVVNVSFNGAENVDFVKSSDGMQITFKVVQKAMSGDILLTEENRNHIIVKGFQTAKPKVTIPNVTYAPMETVKFASTYASRVSYMMINDIKEKVTNSASDITFRIPYNAKSGKVYAIMDNGEIVEQGNITLSQLAVCAISSFENALNVGEDLKASLANPNKLTDVMLDNESVKYTNKDGQLTVNLGKKSGNRVLTLVSDDFKADYNIYVTGSGTVEYVEWQSEDPWKLTWADGNGEGKIYVGASAFKDVPSGSILRMSVLSKGNGWCTFQICDNACHNVVPMGNGKIPNWNTSNVLTADVSLTDEVLTKLKNGMIIQGMNVYFLKISIIVNY